MSSDKCGFCDAAIERMSQLEQVIERQKRELAILRGEETRCRISVLFCLNCRRRILGGQCASHCMSDGKLPYERFPELMEYRDYVFLTSRAFISEPRNVLDRATILFDEAEERDYGV